MINDFVILFSIKFNNTNTHTHPELFLQIRFLDFEIIKSRFVFFFLGINNGGKIKNHKIFTLSRLGGTRNKRAYDIIMVMMVKK